MINNTLMVGFYLCLLQANIFSSVVSDHNANFVQLRKKAIENKKELFLQQYKVSDAIVKKVFQLILDGEPVENYFQQVRECFKENDLSKKYLHWNFFQWIGPWWKYDFVSIEKRINNEVSEDSLLFNNNDQIKIKKFSNVLDGIIRLNGQKEYPPIDAFYDYADFTDSLFRLLNYKIIYEEYADINNEKQIIADLKVIGADNVDNYLTKIFEMKGSDALFLDHVLKKIQTGPFSESTFDTFDTITLNIYWRSRATLISIFGPGKSIFADFKKGTFIIEDDFSKYVDPFEERPFMKELYNAKTVDKKLKLPILTCQSSILDHISKKVCEHMRKYGNAGRYLENICKLMKELPQDNMMRSIFHNLVYNPNMEDQTLPFIPNKFFVTEDEARWEDLEKKVIAFDEMDELETTHMDVQRQKFIFLGIIAVKSGIDTMVYEHSFNQYEFPVKVINRIESYISEIEENFETFVSWSERQKAFDQFDASLINLIKQNIRTLKKMEKNEYPLSKKYEIILMQNFDLVVGAGFFLKIDDNFRHLLTITVNHINLVMKYNCPPDIPNNFFSLWNIFYRRLPVVPDKNNKPKIKEENISKVRISVEHDQDTKNVFKVVELPKNIIKQSSKHSIIYNIYSIFRIFENVLKYFVQIRSMHNK